LLSHFFGPSVARVAKSFNDFVVLPFVPELFYVLKACLCKEGFNVYFCVGTSLRELLFYKCDFVDSSEVKSVVYQLKCGSCDVKYVGSTKRSLQTRVKEHCRDCKHVDKVADVNFSAIARHCIDNGHFMQDSGAVVCREPRERFLRIRESLYIECNAGSLCNVDSEAVPCCKGWISLSSFFKIM